MVKPITSAPPTSPDKNDRGLLYLRASGMSSTKLTAVMIPATKQSTYPTSHVCFIKMGLKRVSEMSAPSGSLSPDSSAMSTMEYELSFNEAFHPIIPLQRTRLKAVARSGYMLQQRQRSMIVEQKCYKEERTTYQRTALRWLALQELVPRISW